jgi:hypothetical protein
MSEPTGTTYVRKDGAKEHNGPNWGDALAGTSKVMGEVKLPIFSQNPSGELLQRANNERGGDKFQSSSAAVSPPRNFHARHLQP